MKRRIRKNVWGNWRGYMGRRWVLEFGTDDVAAGHWLLTGSVVINAGYASARTIRAAREAAGTL